MMVSKFAMGRSFDTGRVTAVLFACFIRAYSNQIRLAMIMVKVAANPTIQMTDRHGRQPSA